jgi:hypothetical protein
MSAKTTSFNSREKTFSKGWLPRLSLIILISALAGAIAPARAQDQDQHQYLPLVIRPALPCPYNVITNGGFEQDDAGWTLFSNGIGPKAHDLIGTFDEGFSPRFGVYAARLGGYEGVVDSIQQPVQIPDQGVFSYYWKMYTNEEPTIVYDYFLANLLNPDGTRLANLASHDNRDQNNIWVQDVFDLSAYAGQLVLLQLYSANDNYFWTKFDIDEVRLCGPRNDLPRTRGD